MLRRRPSYDHSSIRLDFDSLPLYGREEEQRLLAQAYRGASLGDKALVLLSGSSGKTELIQSMIAQKKPSHRILRGCWAPDKRHQEPYGAIVDAFTKFFKSTKISSRLLRKALGKDQAIMTKLVPILRDVCGLNKLSSLQEEEHVNSHTFFNFKEAFCRLTRTLAGREHPVLFFLDDLQWADESSLELFVHLIQDPDSEHILFVGGYDGELSPDIMRKLKSAGGEQMFEIELKNLEFDSINQMICDSMDIPPEETEALTVIVHNKTDGDILHARQFLELLQDMGYLGYSLKLCQWFCDLDAVVTGTSHVTDVNSTCESRLQILPPAIIKTAQYAAFLGIKFDPSVLLKVMCQTDPEMTESMLARNLSKLLKVGMIRRTSCGNFRFCHHRIHQAAYNTTPPDGKDRQLIHLQLGYVLQSIFDSDHGVFFAMVRQLNLGANCLDDQRIKLARLNLEAGKQCDLRSSPLLAVEYFRTALDLLGSAEEQWTNHYDLALQLSNMAVEMYWSCGRLCGVRCWAEQVADHATSVQDTLSSKLTLIQAVAATDVDEAIDLGLGALRDIGFNVREKPKSYHVYPKLYKTKRRLRKLKDEEITRLPICDDESTLKAMKVMGLVVLYTHRSQSIHRSSSKSFLPLLYCKLITLTLKHGISPFASYCFASYGVMMAALGFMEEATRFCNIAVVLMDRAKKNDVRAATLNTIYGNVRHWTTPHNQCVNQFLLAYEAGKTSGHLFQAMESAHAYSICYFMCGYPLGRLANDLHNFCIQARDYGLESLIEPLQALHLMSLNMLGQSDQPLLSNTTNTGEEEGESGAESAVSSPETVAGLVAATRAACQMELAVLRGSLEDMEWIMDAREKVVKTHGELRHCFIGFTRETFIAGLAYVRLCACDSKYRSKAHQCLRMIEKWAVEFGEINIRHYLLILRASLLTLHSCVQQGNLMECIAAFEEAIVAARLGGYYQDEAIANEMVAEYYFEAGDTTLAEARVTRAHQLYSDWQATTKVQQLRSKYGFLHTAREGDENTLNQGAKNSQRRGNKPTTASVVNKKVSFADSQTERSADSTLDIVDPTGT